MEHDNSHAANSLRILSQSKNGYIGRCGCCDHYNFVFGNVLFTFTEDGLDGFNQVLYNPDHWHMLEASLPHDKSYVLPSPIPNFMLSFSKTEMEEMKGLFQEYYIFKELENILKSNHSKNN
jgi:hypothetical protein